MRILYHHRTKSRDGQYVHIEEMQAAFRRKGHVIDEVAPAPEEKTEFGTESRRLARIANMVPRSLYQVMEWGYNAVSFLAIRKAVLAQRPDFIYERYALGNVAGLLAARRFRLPLLLEVNAPLAEERVNYGGLPFPRAARRLETWLLRRCDWVLAVTGVLKRMLVESGAPAGKIVVIPNGINHDRFAKTPDPDEAKRRLGVEGRTVLGFTGFCRDWHGLDRVLRWMSAGPADSHFLIVGDGPACPGLVELARELGLADRLTITGVVARDDVADHVAAFDVALQPEVTPYASPLKLFEYLALGKAVIAPDRENIREVLADGETGLLFPPGDDEAFADALGRLLGDAALRQRIGGNSRRLVDEHPYTWDHNADRVEELARGVIERRRR